MSDNMESDLVPQSSKNEDSDDGKSDKTIIDRTESSSLDMTNERKSIYKIFTNAASAFVAADLSLFSKEKKDKDPNLIKINLAVSVDNVKFIKFVINENSTADDICLLLCQKLGIGPVARQLFALRIHGTNLYLSPSIEIKLQNKENVYDFRIRFQMADVGKLQRLDNKATEYLFHQVRVDLIKGHIIDLDIEKYKPEIMGLVVLDMYRVILEKNISKDDIMTDYIKYVPNAIFRKHFFFTKTPISNSLNDVCRVKRSVIYTIQQYLKAFWEMKSNYPTEIYKADFINGDNSDSVTIKITPFNEEQAGIRFMFDNKQKNFQLLCSIEELCFISINEYNRVEISRKNGIPLYLKFNSKIELTSFISLLDGYYRMMVKWTFNLCKDLPTQSLLKLYKSKCHGPIGGEYSYYKLDQKRDNRSGCFILRECDKKYNEFYIDVCTKNINKPQSFKIEKLNTDEYIFNDDVTRYKSIIQLIRSYNDPKNPIYLKECLPPSEYDDSPLLLLCKEEKFEKHKFSNELIMSDLTSFRTIVINARELQVYKSVGIEYFGKRNRTQTNRKCLKWNVSERKVKIGYNSVKFEKKFAWERFPDDSIKSARKFCRNPDGDLAGPWCYIRIENTNIIEKDYCDIDFCDKMECVVITYNQSLNFLSNHFTNLNNDTLFQFAIKYWNSDAFVSNDQARLILSEYPLSIVEQDFIEIFISNNITGIRIKNESNYQSIKSKGLLSSYQFKTFFLSLESNGFISLRVDNEKVPPLLSINNSQLNEKMKYYSITGTNFMWKMNNCEKKTCEIHTTIDLNFNRFQLLDKIISKKDTVTYELRMFVRSTGSSQICLRSSAILPHPYILIEFSNFMNTTRISVQRFKNGPIKLLGEKLMFGEFLLRYWEWCELHFMIVDDILTLFYKTDFGLVLLMKVKHFEIMKMRWFSIGSFKSVSHWTFFCTPVDKDLISKPEYPDCLLKSGDPYNGTQWFGEKGFPCVPWKHSNISKHIKSLFNNEDDLLNSRNYCRNPGGQQQDTNYCYYLHNNILQRQNCSIRLCKQFGCKIAGTGNDYMGKINVTISGRICKHWTAEDPIIDTKLMNKKLFPDKSIELTENYCRNPSRKIAGVWCYVNDTKIFSDICNIEDCSISNQDLILLRGNDHNNYFFILPHWKVENLGLRFALKVWNPDFNNGFIVDLVSFTNRYGKIRLIVGAKKNKKIQLYYTDSENQFEKMKEITQPHVLYSGKWTSLILEIRNNELTLSRDFGGDTIFYWDGSRQNMSSPTLMNIMPPNNYTLGKKLDCDNGVITVYRSIWRVNECKKIETTLKVLNKNFYDKNSNEFLKIASQWAFLHTNSIIRLFGITIHNPIAMVMEYMKLGPLDKYLQEKKTSMKQVELVEAASNLAAALYYLEENGIIHGKIRCRKLFVSSHNEKSFSVRLADPGIAKPFTTDDIHWIPCENYSDFDTARQSKTADTWALSTTLWEIFMYGEQPPNLQNNRMFYLNGKRLSQPTNCPSNIYQIMFDCWNKDPDKRKIPQEILRDINRILYQAYNSRESHSYAKVALKNIPENIESNLCMSSSPSTSISNITDEANLELKEYNPINLEMPECSSYFHSESRQIENVENVSTTNYNIANTDSYTVSNINVNLEKTRLSSSMTSIDSIESVFEFDEHCNVVLQGRIGQGFYGEVFKGTLEWIHEKRDSRKVAIKKLKTSCITLTSLKDFEREISIMKALKHPNIVEILGIIQEPEISLIMEYLDHGSLQCYLKIHKESLSIPQLLKFSLDVAKGMQYLGEQNVIHRDLAARNILVVNESTVKISDFGLAQVLGSSDYYILQTCRDLPIKWYALESLRDGKFSPRSDVWSYGVTLYEIFSFGEDPQLVSNNVDSDHEQVILLKALEQGRRYPCPVNCPQGIYVRIIHPCWNADAHSRPIFRQLCIEIEGLLESY